MTAIKIAFITGTRPEIIKLSPLFHALTERDVSVSWCHSGQHDDLAEQTFRQFNISPDVELNRPANESVASLTGGLILSLGEFITTRRFHALCVQGDTSTALAGALTGFYAHIPVIHVEAGLRSGDVGQPFPEESNRRLISHIATRHYAPTATAVAALQKEGIPLSTILMTGNTGIDAQNYLRRKSRQKGPNGPVLVTAHRRENWPRLETICQALLRLSCDHPQLSFVFAMHANPRLQKIVVDTIGGHERIKVLPPIDYFQLQELLSNAPLVLTDSGGIQEEAPTYQVPVVVLRDKTERPELIDCGMARLVGSENIDKIVHAANELLAARKTFQDMPNPFGDGMASQYIADDLLKHLILSIE